MKVMPLDPDWKFWAKCPMPNCTTVTHGCCEAHVRDSVAAHLVDAHDATVYKTDED